MIVEFTQDQFTLNGGLYYSSPFKIENADNLMSVQALATISATVSIQQSIDGINWYDVLNSGFLCNTLGMQSYIECQPELFYRLKSTGSVTNAKIVL